MQTIDRDRLVATVRVALESNPAVDAAWEGGSAAFTALDEYSDVDAVAVVADDAVSEVFESVESALKLLSPVALRCDMPAQPGFAQKFYRLRDASEFLVVDLVLLRRGEPLMFRDVELHGRGHTWFDRSGVLVESHIDEAADLSLARARIPSLRDAFAMFQHIPTKERLRGRAVEALHFYQAMSLRPLVEALRLLHCPHRRNFGTRYLARDLPPDVVDRIVALSFVSDLTDLARQHEAVQRWFWECIGILERLGPGACAVQLTETAPAAAR